MRTIWDRLTEAEKQKAEKVCSQRTLHAFKTVKHARMLYVFDWFDLQYICTGTSDMLSDFYKRFRKP